MFSFQLNNICEVFNLQMIDNRQYMRKCSYIISTIIYHLFIKYDILLIEIFNACLELRDKSQELVV